MTGDRGQIPLRTLVAALVVSLMVWGLVVAVAVALA